MKIKDALLMANKLLKAAKIKGAASESRLLLGFILDKSPEYILSNNNEGVRTFNLHKFQKIIIKRTTHHPISYLTKEKYFYNEPFFVNESVLIPRPETELIVDEALRIIGNKNLHVCEIGTGSGCISISLSRLAPQANFIATDISKAASNVAKKNNLRHKTKVKFLLGDLLAPCTDKPVDLLIANLPYIPNDLSKLTKSIYSKSLDFEPRIALTSGIDGLDHYRKLFTQIAARANKPKYILIEIGENQTNKIKKIIKTHLMTKRIEFTKDLRGLNRMVKITL